MLNRTKLLVTALAAAAMMLTLVANASAGRLSVSEKEFEVNFRPLTFNAAGRVIRCPITLLGHFNENTIAKRAATIGAIRHVEPTTAGEPPCTGGTITVLNETLPWRINYVSFSGTLPAITSIRLSLIGVAFKVRTSLATCLAGTTATAPAFGEVLVGTGGRVEGLRADERVGIPLGGGFVCELAGNSTFEGTGTVTNLPGTAPITVTLI